MTLQPDFGLRLPTSPEPPKHALYEGMWVCLGAIIGALGSVPGLCCFPNPYKTIPQGNVGLVTRFGKWYKTVDPGLHYIQPFTEKYYVQDIRLRVSDIPKQAVMTKVCLIISS